MGSGGALTVERYSARALEAEQKGPELVTLEFALLGIFGETGSLLSAVKKKQRDRATFVGYESVVLEELGDTLWYLNAVAKRSSVKLSGLAACIHKGTYDSVDGGDGEVAFHDLQPSAKGIRTEPSKEFEETLLALAGHVGVLVADHKSGRMTDRARLIESLLAILRSLVSAATEAGVLLCDAANENLAKTADRWPSERIFKKSVDEHLRPYEQLPRELTIDIFEEPSDTPNKNYVYQRANGINIGDRLTDNIEEPDDYRFHDVFHYAYVAVLGWSPVMRALLRAKRKSLPLKDEAQDGARAILIEEGITTWIFNQAKSLELFKGVERGQLSFELLKTVRRFVEGYEPHDTPLWMWEEAILQGYDAFRFLKRHRRGRATIDMRAHKLHIEALPE